MHIVFVCNFPNIFNVFTSPLIYTVQQALIEFQYNISICMVVIYFLYRFVILKYLTIKYAPDKVHNYKTLIQNKWQQLAAIGGIIHFFSNLSSNGLVHLNWVNIKPNYYSRFFYIIFDKLSNIVGIFKQSLFMPAHHPHPSLYRRPELLYQKINNIRMYRNKQHVLFVRNVCEQAWTELW